MREIGLGKNRRCGHDVAYVTPPSPIPLIAELSNNYENMRIHHTDPDRHEQRL
jgi:hypothetical protein